MGFDDYALVALPPGKTIEVKLDQLPRAPIVHLEHLGETNKAYLDDQIAQANAKFAWEAGSKKKQISKKKLAERRQKCADILVKHSVRKLETTHSNGAEATLADVPLWMETIIKFTPELVDLMWDLANNAENYRDAPASDPKELAEK